MNSTAERIATAKVVVAAVAVLSLLATSGCGGSSHDGTGAKTRQRAAPRETGATGPVPADSAWGKVLSRIGPDGTVDEATALAAFALAFGPLPGFEVPAGASGNVADGSEALRWAVRLRDRFTDEQRAAVDRVVAATAGGGGARRSVGSGDGPGTGRYRTLIDEMLSRYKGPLGPLPIPTTVALVGFEGKALAYANGFDSNGDQQGAAVRCAIGITPSGRKADDEQIDLIIAHEVFHCYQATWLGLARYYNDESVAPWVIEGAATWAEFNTVPAQQVAQRDNWWIPYLATPTRSLFSRSYDAVGFYGQVRQQGVELWPLMQQFHTAADNVTRYHILADPAGAGLLDAWAPGYFRRPVRGAAWDITGKFVPDPGTLEPPVDELNVTNGTERAVSAKPFTNSLEVLDTTADLTHLAFVGHARLADESGFDSTELTDLYLCTRSGGDCSCPDQSDGDGGSGLPASRQSPTGTLILGLTGGTDGTAGTVSGQSLDDFCAKRKAAKKATSTLPPCQVVTPDDASRLVPALAGARHDETVLNPNGSGICAYVDATGAAALDAQVYHRPQGAPVEQDYATYAAAICNEELPGIGQRAGVGASNGGVFGCLLSNSTIVTMAIVGGSREAVPETLKAIAARL